MPLIPDPDGTRRDALHAFARWSHGEVPSGHAAGQVVAALDDVVVIDFGEAYAWFRRELFPGVEVADFVTVGPGVSRWGVIPK